MAYRELFRSPEGTDALNRGSTDRRYFFVSGTDDLDTALQEIAEDAQADYRGLIYQSVDHERAGPNLWFFTVNYKDSDRADQEAKLETGTYKISFDTTGATARKKYAFAQRAYPATGKQAPTLYGAIGVDTEGKIEGVDVVIPSLKFSITYRQPKATITLAYVLTLKALTGKTNNATFFGFAPGELLFLGATGSDGTDADPEVTYNFIASENVTGLTIAGISGITKLGHQYLWVYTQMKADPDSKTLVPETICVFVDDVIQSADFGLLGIGTT